MILMSWLNDGSLMVNGFMMLLMMLANKWLGWENMGDLSKISWPLVSISCFCFPPRWWASDLRTFNWNLQPGGSTGSTPSDGRTKRGNPTVPVVSRHLLQQLCYRRFRITFSNSSATTVDWHYLRSEPLARLALDFDEDPGEHAREVRAGVRARIWWWIVITKNHLYIIYPYIYMFNREAVF